MRSVLVLAVGACGSTSSPAATPPPAARGEIQTPIDDGSPVSVAPRTHAIVCTVLWAQHVSDTKDRDNLGCPVSPPPLAHGDQPCRIREPITITLDLAFDAAGRLSRIDRTAGTDKSHYELAYDTSGRLEQIRMPERYRLERTYEGNQVDHDEIGGSTYRTRYTLANERLARVEYFYGDLAQSPDLELWNTKTLTYRGDGVVATDERDRDGKRWVRTRASWDAKGRPARVALENSARQTGQTVFTYDAHDRPVSINEARIEYDCANSR